MNRNKNLFHFIIATFYAPVLALSFLGLAAPYISTSIFSWIQLIPNLFPALALFHFLAILLFIRKFKLLSLLAFLALLGSGWVISKDWKMGAEQEMAHESHSLKVLSYNVGTFDFKAENIDTSSELLKSLEPDVITLQEFRNHKLADGSYAIDYMSRALDMPYHRFVHLPVHIHGAVIYSRYPILDIDTLFMPRKEINSGILASIETPVGMVGVGNVHLSSFQIAQTYNETEGFFDKLIAIFRRARMVVKLQNDKVDQILSKTAKYPNPIIITGDMNATPHTRVNYLLSQKMNDSFREGGSGIGWSYPLLNKMLGLRIDHQYASSEFDVLEHKIVREGVSDHYPVIVTYRIQP